MPKTISLFHAQLLVVKSLLKNHREVGKNYEKFATLEQRQDKQV